ncbi:MAG: MBOAT family protein [Bacteroidaceae bacterium]|nr:MBOAT family protein [Bacteroidaceae bacterium]
MVFSDLFFIYAFIPSFALCYLLSYHLDKRHEAEKTGGKDCQLPQMTWKNATLIVFSLIFYAWGEPLYVFLMLVSVLINYVCGIMVNKWGKWSLILGVLGNLLFLGVFKYAGFFANIITQFGYPVPAPDIDLPIGISFYTFQSISYLVDVYRGEAPVQKKFTGLLLYISMFPQLIAGPIVRYNTVAQEINNRKVSVDDFAEGTYRFFIGLGKKVIFANQFSEIADNFLASGFDNLTTSGAWLGIAAFTLQIYFDFSGYSDMAIGMGRCLGFHFNENFNHPYCCNSITDFWRRWHISLGSFFRDYVYIPLGGNRRHQYWNIFVVWGLTGMWHGASWNFILWGLYFGIIVSIEKFTILKRQDNNHRLLRHVYAMLLVVIGWGIFYFDDLSKMGQFFAISFGFMHQWHSFVTESAITDNFWLWIAAVVCCIPTRRWLSDKATQLLHTNWLRESSFTLCRITFTLLMLVVCTALLVGATNNAFIYTRF